MTLPEVAASEFLQPAFLGVHGRKQASFLRSDENRDHDASIKRGRGVSSPVQDHVTLSKEAQALATSTSQSSTNNSFQQSPSPLDR
ncbi:MAG: hypothetical protein CO149_00835 [Nitrospirae bacterium CG_4_9_14_3_um_filter_51_5]|nr:MAG: hypothetical protein CO149_00835 [Nitrospirae bacterium CG_4_9_14_3_um_filter_51_5]